MNKPEKMSVSYLERYMRIVETVRLSDQHLSPRDRLELIDELLDQHGNHSTEYIEHRCKKMSDERSGDNMIDAMILRDAHGRY